MRAAAIRRRLSEVFPSRSDYQRLSDYPARNGRRLSSDYSATIVRRIPQRSFSKLSKNFSKTRSEFFQNRSEIRAVFCAAGVGLPRRCGPGSGGSAGLEAAGDSRGRSRQARAAGSAGLPAAWASAVRSGAAWCAAPLMCRHERACGCNGAVGRVGGRSGAFMVWDRYLYPLAQKTL